MKKKLFSFNNYLSTKEFFYNKTKYHLCYKIKNHLSEEFTRVLITPIIDMENYLPEFSQFDTKDLFKQTDLNKKSLYKITNLNLIKFFFDKKKKLEEKQLNQHFILSKKNSELLTNNNLDIELLANNFILKEKFQNNKIDNYMFNIKKACLIFHHYHIKGIFYNNEEEIGFFSFQLETNKENEYYDEERKICLGSLFLNQNKSKYYHLKILYEEIEFILKRRYIFKRNSFEIFTMKKKSYFFQIEEEEIENLLINIKKNLEKKKNYQIEEIYIEYNQYFYPLGYVNKSNNNNKNEEKYNLNLQKLYDNWRNYKISTLNIITILNVYSNRTYNDLNQYYICPWIYIDYSSLNFEMNNEKNIVL